MTINRKIARIRHFKGLSQEWMAHEMGISQNSYSRLESGHTKLTTEHLGKIATLFDMKPEEIYALEDNLVFNNYGKQEGFFGNNSNPILNASEKERELYEARIKALEKEVDFLRDLLKAERPPKA